MRSTSGQASAATPRLQYGVEVRPDGKDSTVEDALMPVVALVAFIHFLDIEVGPWVAFHELAPKQA